MKIRKTGLALLVLTIIANVLAVNDKALTNLSNNETITANALGSQGPCIKSGDYRYVILDDGTAEITIYNGKEENLTIPSEIDGRKVVSFDAWLGMPLQPGDHPGGCLVAPFGLCVNLKTVTIPDTVYNIGNSAFELCYNLESVVIPRSMKNIGSYVFDGCDKLSDIYYSGTEEEWNNISIDNYNYELKKATIHYNHAAVKEVNGSVYYQVKNNSSMLRFIAEVDIDDIKDSDYSNIMINVNGEKCNLKTRRAYYSIISNGKKIAAPEGKCYVISPIIETSDDGGDIITVEYTFDGYAGCINREITI